jgi:hypothetical protein
MPLSSRHSTCERQRWLSHACQKALQKPRIMCVVYCSTCCRLHGQIEVERQYTWTCLSVQGYSCCQLATDMALDAAKQLQ